MDNATIDRRKALLKDLFDKREADLVIKGLGELLEKHRSRFLHRRTGEVNFSERDVILITYPDQLNEAGIPPLRTLSDFCGRYLRGLIPCLHILPFFPSSSDDGFSVMDYRSVDPSLGTWEDISRLSEPFRLMIDAVVNHVSTRCDWFQKFLRGGKMFRNFFIEVSGTPDLSNVVRPRSTPLLHRYGTASMQKTVWTTFSDDQVDLNYRNPRVLLEIVDLLLFYVSRGASIIRLDAVAYLWKEIGTPCISLLQTHRIVQLFRSVLDEVAPDVKLVSETNVPHAENISYFGNGSDEVHLAYNFALHPMILHTFRTGDSRALSRWTDGLRLPPGKAAFLNFLASHDGIGLNGARDILRESDIQTLVQMAVDRGGKISFRRNPDGTMEPYELNINFFDALSAPAGGESLDLSISRFLAAHAVLFSLAGVPAIYFHSLFGSRGWPQGIEQTGINRTINRQKFERSKIERELADESSLRHRVFEGMAGLIRARAASRAFDPQAVQRPLDVGRGVFCIQRRLPGRGSGMLCLHNVTDRDQEIRLDAGGIFHPLPGGRAITDVLSGRRFDPRRMDPFPLGPYQVCWLSSGDDPSHG